LTEYLKIPPQNVIIAGDSAGDGFAIPLLMYLRDSGFPMPGGAIQMSPWVDLTMSCASWDSNTEFDICPVTSAGDHLNPVYCYLGSEGMKKGMVIDPFASPPFRRFEGLPPMLIQCGEVKYCAMNAHSWLIRRREQGLPWPPTIMS
jgi:acetyl esterase/lipase